MQVFICYSRVDKAFATHLYQNLSDYDLKVWMDVYQIPSGANWDTEVQRGLESSDSMLVLLSPASTISENVTDEWNYFLDKKRLILPLKIEQCEIPFRLLRKEWIDFTADYKLGFQQLIRALGSPALLDPESTQQLRPVKGAKPTNIPLPAESLPAAPYPDSRTKQNTGPLRASPAVAPEVGIKMLPIVWADSYHWLNGMGNNAMSGDLLISQNVLQFVPRARPIMTIPLSSLVSVQPQRSIDQYLKLTYYNSEGQFQSLVLMGAAKDRRTAINEEILNLLKFFTRHSL